MQVSAISQAASFGQAHDYKINGQLTEDKIQKLALQKTFEQAKKRQQNIKRMLLSVPLLAGLAAAVTHQGASKVLTKEISGVAGRLAEGFKSGGKWASWLGIGLAMSLGNVAIARKSESYKNFRNNHPVISFAMDAAMFLAATAAIPLGLGKLASKMPGQVEKFANGVENIAGHINNFKTPEFIKTAGKKVTDLIPKSLKDLKTNLADKIPVKAKTVGTVTKELGKLGVSLMPHITLLAAIFTGLTNNSRAVSDYAKNYANIKQQVEEAKL